MIHREQKIPNKEHNFYDAYLCILLPRIVNIGSTEYRNINLRDRASMNAPVYKS